MLEIKFVRQNLERVRQALADRGQPIDLDRFDAADQGRRRTLAEAEELRHRRNKVSDEIAELKKSGQDAGDLIAEMREVSGRIKSLEKSLSEDEQMLERMLLEIPNLPHESVPVGKDEQDNLLVKSVGEPPEFDFEPQAHWDVGAKLKILDFERASRITGARFPLYFGAGARMERALINFMLDVHIQEHGYQEVLPPFIVNRESMTHTGQLPKFAEDLFKLEGWDYFLVPTAEVPVTNIHAGETLEAEQLPIRYTAFTPCFRSEAGSYGKDTRGLIRQHQFNKVELVKFCLPETSYEELETLLSDAEEILARLELPYRVVTLCTGDLGFSAAKTYDIEVWMPAQGVYREISSCSNFEDFQARRGNIRFRRKGKKGTELVHTLNGSGLAVGRTVAAILENCQAADGTVAVPPPLRPYMGGMERIQP
ncbi:MAG: serine--tRNA ligase [Desulfobacterales bacterium]|nr:serine--tRNA ligase [Desulfobacterales bacterium]MCF8079681.1 serine--tRNA ligase [Desulfobacterales bacterium]